MEITRFSYTYKVITKPMDNSRNVQSFWKFHLENSFKIAATFTDAEFIAYDVCCAGDDGQLCDGHIGSIELECK